MLIITNGDSAVGAMNAAGIPAAKLPWRDVLHDGPVPAGLELDELSDVRAHFISGCGWGDPEQVRRDFADRDAALEAFTSYDEVVLWFEHDLYDQLQLFQLLDWFSHQDLDGTRLSLVQEPDFIAEGPSDRLPKRLAERTEVSAEQLDLGHRAWAAFTAPERAALERLQAEDTNILPFLRPAIARVLEEYPDAATGLARSERQILEGLTEGRRSAGDLFRAVQAMEEARYLGDASFFQYVERLAGGKEPLLLASGETFELTPTGRQVLSGERDWIAIAGIDRWIGGVHLSVRTGPRPR